MSQNENLNKIYNIKIILLGETGVGKTCLINVYIDKQFNSTEIITSQSNLSFKIIEIHNKKLSLNIWDTMGHERYRSITKNFIKGSNIIIFVYDITDKNSFLELNFWVNSVFEILSKDEAIFGVVGNKADLFTKSEIKTNEAEEYAEKIGALFTEASAKNNAEGFKSFVNILLEKLINTPNIIEKLGKIENESNFQLENPSKGNKKKNCC